MEGRSGGVQVCSSVCQSVRHTYVILRGSPKTHDFQLTFNHISLKRKIKVITAFKRSLQATYRPTDRWTIYPSVGPSVSKKR